VCLVLLMELELHKRAPHHVAVLADDVHAHPLAVRAVAVDAEQGLPRAPRGHCLERPREEQKCAARLLLRRF